MRGLIRNINLRDIKLFYLLNNVIRCGVLNKIMPWITQLGGSIFTISGCVLLLVFGNHHKNPVGYRCAASIIATNIIVQILKRSVTRIRPFKALQGVIVYDSSLRDYSFPSGHTASAFSIFIVLAIAFPVFSPLLVFSAASVAFSRVYLGVHYPTDVIIGAFIGSFTAFMSYSLLSSSVFVYF